MNQKNANENDVSRTIPANVDLSTSSSPHPHGLQHWLRLTDSVDADLAWHVPAHACNADAPVSDVCAVAAMLALNHRYGPSATRAPEFLIVQEVLVYDGPAAAGLFNVQIANTTAYAE
ncbi:hypothetical protein HYQ46_002834 [Verticillium longisporum]|nr:hypothetical protein HYQ44_007697 [Verticillium longisporum]KAG7148302.1 hypothetical protein HYQ46_002834 [Verticillium longisporum]